MKIIGKKIIITDQNHTNHRKLNLMIPVKIFTIVIHDVKNALLLVLQSKIVLFISLVLTISQVLDLLFLNTIFRYFSHDSLIAAKKVFSFWNFGFTIFQIGWSGLAVYIVKKNLKNQVITPKELVGKWWYYFKNLLIPTFFIGLIGLFIFIIQMNTCKPLFPNIAWRCDNIYYIVLVNTYGLLTSLTMSGLIVILTAEQFSVIKSIKHSYGFYKKNLVTLLAWLILFVSWKQIPLDQILILPIFGKGILILISSLFTIFTNAFLLISYLRIQKTISPQNLKS